MSITGIVSEFNPFHNGHKYLIDAVRNDGDTVVCVMSGNFTQRVEPAVFSKEIRAKAALENGADIILELPFVYATATAEIFAQNAVKALCEFGCDTIAFGAECDDTALLIKAAEIIASDSFEVKLKNCLTEGVSYPAARQKAFESYNIPVDLSSPNNILAVEYIKAVKKYYPDTKLKAVKRVGAMHDSTFTSESIASASLIRNLIAEGGEYSHFVPENAFSLYENCRNENRITDFEKYSTALLAILRSRAENINIAYITEELNSRLDNAIKTATKLDELYSLAKTKRYTHSRVRRAVLCRAFGISESDIKISLPYIRVLGFNESRASVLGKCSKACRLPVVSTYSELKSLGNQNADRVFSLECKASDIFTLCNKSAEKCGSEQEYMLVKIK